MIKRFVFCVSLACLCADSSHCAQHVDALGDPLPPGVLWRQGTARLRHDDGLLGLAFSPDGKLLASCGYDAFVRVWSVPDGKEIRAFLLDGINPHPFAVAFSPDGKLLAAVDSDLTPTAATRVWDMRTGKEKLRLQGTGITLAFSPDGKRLFTAGIEVTAWSVDTGQKLRATKDPNLQANQYIYCLGLLPDAKTVAFARSIYNAKPGQRDLILWDSETGKETRPTPSTGKQIQSIVLSEDGATLAVAQEEEVVLWNVADWKNVRAFKTTGQPVQYVPKASDLGERALDGRILIWDTATGKNTRTLFKIQPPAGPVSFSSDGKMLASGDEHGAIRL
ncbi:MAG: WD40 repeat domain-containing protein [Gemmataceae bacterium]|nr:WD40 repeat domain-containing protein [Gemmataceae bacterium]MCI0739650.1 WD40 repeat domain-containing protein [Gemmataceae bacterium]